MKEATFEVTLRCKKKIDPERMSAAIQAALNGAMDADIDGSEYLNGTVVEYQGITVTPNGVASPTKQRGLSGPGM